MMLLVITAFLTLSGTQIPNTHLPFSALFIVFARFSTSVDQPP